MGRTYGAKATNTEWRVCCEYLLGEGQSVKVLDKVYPSMTKMAEELKVPYCMLRKYHLSPQEQTYFTPKISVMRVK